jgi:hypothetical protein
MLKKIQLLFAFALALPAASYGIVGGPFDNADYSSTLDDAGIYQASLRFSNGQGMAQFATNADVAPYRLQTGTTTTTPPSSYGSYLNRSVIYYKGVTYLGTATGIVDHYYTKTVEGYTNGNSDVNTTVVTNQAATPTAVNATASLLDNGGRYFTCNTTWTGKITSRAPILTFKGKGQLTVISPDAGTQTTGIVTNLVNSLTSLLTNPVPPSSPGSGPQGSYTASEINQINATLLTIRYLTTGKLPTFNAAGQLTSSPTDLPPEAALPKASDLTQQGADSVPLTVYGTRKFFSTGTILASNRR